MTHREFVEAVRKLANGRYCSARVEVVTLEARIDRPERYEIQCDAYIGGVGWTMPYPTPERALSELLSRIECEHVDSEAVDALGEVPSL